MSGGSGTVVDNRIEHIRAPDEIGCQYGRGIDARGTLTASGNEITDYAKLGITERGAGTSNQIENNTVVGLGPLNNQAQNAIWVSSGASATITGNKFSHNQYTGPQDTDGGGIVLIGNGTFTVTNNESTDNDIGLWVYGVPGNATLSDNTLTGGEVGIQLAASNGVQVKHNTTSGQSTYGLQATEDASDNTFDGNTASGVTGQGHFDCRDESSGDKTAGTKNTWTNNTAPTAYPDEICSPKSEEPSGGGGEPTEPSEPVDVNRRT